MTGGPPVFEEFASAKVNLYLRVGAPRADGLHPLDSLAAFASIGDWVRVAPAQGLALEVAGPFARALNAEPDNLVLRAARLLAEAFNIDPGNGASISLEKNLPIASGIGGGSADAAAALRALSRLWNISADADLSGVARKLGADVPACLAQRSCIMRGAGDELTPASVPKMGVVLANAGEAVPTPAVYRKFDALGFGAGFKEAPAPDVFHAAGFIAALAATANDLETPAFELEPDIKQLKKDMAGLPGCGLSRMSGSGGTVFSLFADPFEAPAAAEALRRSNPGLWVAAGRLGG